MKRWLVAIVVVAACYPGAPSSDRSPAEATAAAEVFMSASADAWNRGDLEAFVDDYARDSTTTFVAGGRVQYGWEWINDNYSGWWDLGSERDSLRFEDVAARSLGSDYLLTTARFVLFRGDSVTASGPFTLVMKRIEGEWKIIHDQTGTDG
jgi:ketosteroid isomerase-like protein